LEKTVKIIKLRCKFCIITFKEGGPQEKLLPDNSRTLNSKKFKYLKKKHFETEKIIEKNIL
jgi:hypothetical protein